MQHAVIPIYAGMSNNDFFTDSAILFPPVPKKDVRFRNGNSRTYCSGFYGSISSLIKLEIFQPFRSPTEWWVSKANKIVRKARFRLRAVSSVRLAKACLKSSTAAKRTGSCRKHNFIRSYFPNSTFDLLWLSAESAHFDISALLHMPVHRISTTYPQGNDRHAAGSLFHCNTDK